MDIMITPSNLAGGLNAIASKSHAHRVLICAALSSGETAINLSHTSRDIEATVSCLQNLGARISRKDGILRVTPGAVPKQAQLDCEESGSTLRFLLPIAAALCETVAFSGAGRLPERPLSPLMEEMESHGVNFSNRHLPFRVTKMQSGGVFTLPGDVSSQYISGLLMAAPLLHDDVFIKLTSALESAGYVDMTIAAMTQFGVTVEVSEDGFAVAGGQRYISPGTADIEGDWSNAAFWLTAGALSGGILCGNLSLESKQGDQAITGILAAMGADVKWRDGFMTVSPKPLKGTVIDAADIPDLVPILAVAASVADGETLIKNAARLRLKESDRLDSVSDMLCSLGAEIEELPDGLLIHGKPQLRGGAVDSWGDHRIAMAAAVAACVCREPVIIKDAQAVEKSYPGFWDDYKKLGGVLDVV